jgi:hypothetical protein
MQSKAIHWFFNSAGALLLASATAIVVGNVAGVGWVPPHDSLLMISMPIVFWIVGAIEMAVGLVCIFGTKDCLKFGLILWLATAFLAYQIGLFWTVGLRSFDGYWGNVAVAFHVPPDTTRWILMAMFIYLLIGSVISLLWPPASKFQKDTKG